LKPHYNKLLLQYCTYVLLLFFDAGPCVYFTVLISVECKREIEECSRLVGEVRRLEVELGEAQSQLLAVGFQQESDLIAEKDKCQNEISSLQQLIQGAYTQMSVLL
jgi:hypothetical protein